MVGPAAVAQTATPPNIPAVGRHLADFIPVGYGILHNGQAIGDLNHDGKADVAVVVGPTAEDTLALASRLPPRLLLVLFRTTTGYALAAQSRRAVWAKADGGPLGDPFAGVTIKNESLLIQHDVGGNWGHGQTVRFRFQQGAFYLIGETQEYSRHAPDCDQLPFPPRYDYRDTNFITGEYEEIRTSEECRLLVKKRGRRPPQPLRRLADYAVQP